MVKIKQLIWCLAIIGFSVGYGQERPLRFKSALSFAPGLMTENTQTVQLQGYLGFRPQNSRVELRGDGFYFLNATGDRPRFSMNHQLFAGAFYRLNDQAWQPYGGFQPGIAFSQSSEYGALDEETGLLVYKKSVNPVGAVVAGVDFLAEKYFFMFAETRYIFGKHKSDTHPVFLDEWRFSFGLGVYL